MSRHEDVRIGSLAYQGAGVARLASGKTVFVEGAAAGDVARVRIRDERERFARAVIEELLEPSPERTEPACPHHAHCGGCGLQHVAYPAQLKHKRRFVLDALERIGGIEDAEGLVSETVASPLEWGYRNRVEFEPLRQGGRLALGLHAANSTEVIPITRCLLLPEGYMDLPARLAGALGFALKSGDAPLRRVGIRISRATGDVELVLWTEPGPCNRSFVAKVCGDALKTSSLVRVLATGPLEKRDIRKVEVLSGHGFWRERVGGLRYKVSAPSFFQVNSPAAELLVERVLEGLGGLEGVEEGCGTAGARGSADDGEEARSGGAGLCGAGGVAGAGAGLRNGHVIDLYSGVGTFTLPLARRAGRVTAIEIAASSVRDLRRNLADHGLGDKVEVLGGDAAPLLGALGGSARSTEPRDDGGNVPLPGERNAIDCAVVDPPRGGLTSHAREALIAAAPPTLVYVSCDPATLARDLRALGAAGYRIARVTPVDLFPQTWHIETVTRLVHRASDERH